MEYLLTADEMAAVDRYTSEVIGIPSLVLMERAALGVAGAVRKDCPNTGRTIRCAVAAGKGNNGADALAAGRILLDAGYEVAFYLAGGLPEQHSGTSLGVQIGILQHYGAVLAPFSPEDFRNYRPDIIIDGLFGTGLSREVKEPYRSAVETINSVRRKNGARVFAVDIPSGIDGTTGEIRGIAVQADVTVTFSFYKRGHFLYPGCEYCGRLEKADIGITGRSFRAFLKPDSGDDPTNGDDRHPDNGGEDAEKDANSAVRTGVPELFTYREETITDLLPPRDPSGNKGTFGKVLVIAGSKGVSGACTMCAAAALRMGAGMVKVFTHESNRVILQETVPEAMVSTYTEWEGDVPADRNSSHNREPQDYSDCRRYQGRTEKQLEQDLQWASVIAIGPGMGKTPTALHILQYVLLHSKEKKLVIDADAIRLIAENHLYEDLRRAGENGTVVLTPHMAECAALLQMPISDLKENRFSSIKKFAKLYKCTIIGKDARSLAASCESGQQYLNTSGNDGLSTAGSGDVLTGITAGCLAQGMEGFSGACAASYIHGRLADRLAARIDRRSITATDLVRELCCI